MSKNQIISPEYLVEISKQVDSLNYFYENAGIGSLSNQYKKVLVSTFTTLNENMQIYWNSQDNSDDNQQNEAMTQASIIRCRAELQIYCLKKLGQLIQSQTPELGQIIKNISNYYERNIDDFENAILCERRKRLEYIETQKDRTIEHLKRELTEKKNYIEELKEHISEIQQQNSRLYQKMITSAKMSSQRVLSPFKNLHSSPEKTRITTELMQQQLQSTSHKTLSSKQVEQTIIDIMQTKQKQYALKGKTTSVNTFLKTYFRSKFGIKGLAQQTEANFKQALNYFTQTQKNIFILFSKLLTEECDEQYYWQQKASTDRLIKQTKRYINEKQGISLDELEKVYDNKIIDERIDIKLNEKDIHHILKNYYKSVEIDSLQMIFNQLMIPKLLDSNTSSLNSTGRKQQFQSSSANNKGILIPSKKLINQILNYQLRRHMTKIQDIIRLIHQLDNGRGLLNSQQLQTAMIQLNIPTQKMQANLALLHSLSDKFLTYSQFIEIIQKVRKTKIKKKY